MKRLFLSLAAFAACICGLAQNITGSVTCGGKGVAGVAVSDGITVTTTDSLGHYALQSDKRYGYVFVSMPRGYEVPMADGFNPQFWQLLNAPAATAERHNFTLTPADNDHFRLIAGADPQISNRHNDRKRYRNGFINRMKQEKASAGVPIYSVILGDITWDAFWYSNGYTPNSHLKFQRKVGYPIPYFPVMGNHDNNPSTLCTDSTDFAASATWRTTMAPSYYSFNIGKVHFVVLDNIIYKNEPAPATKKLRKGVKGLRNYDAAVTPEQIEWLKQDLALVSKDHPVFVCFHIPTFRINSEFETYGATQNYAELAECFNGFSQVHFMSGHTHYNYTAQPKEYPNIVEHNIAAIGGTLWTTGPLCGTNICVDGSPAGYERFSINGDTVQWKYASCEYPSDPQMHLVDINEVQRFLATDPVAAQMTHDYTFIPTYADFKPNTVLANIYGYGPGWTVTATEGNGAPVEVERVIAIDPTYLLAYALPSYRQGEKLSTDRLRTSAHIFKAMASTPNEPVTVTATDPFGNTYTATITRPAPFTLPFKTEK